ncbi:integrating conjugative element protein [Burkholderia pseudomallei]|uniref:integrating conjugative element protein n=1 Tax=Burkholderia pseudomallei TaxID=28450 RepID=UPI001A9E77A6|nr:integrating conjugative element protein [Burkholderia pseudomallei]QTB44307.1 integrating conjugative element protein [Burkholderia pseudomallei]QTB67325.1 integrating conjugative element protein [Burkholderia pseudomallei]
MKPSCRYVCVALLGLAGIASAQDLIVVGDDGGVSALPYYRALNLLPEPATAVASAPPPIPHAQYREVDLLPVHSARLTPGRVTPRTLRAPGLSPFFLIGDDAPSHAWLHARGDTLRTLGATGLVVNVGAAPALAALRRDAPGLTLVPASGDDIAARLHLSHYPVLVTATGIEQ